MCVDYAIHDTDSGNPHCHIMLTMRPLDERGAWAAKSKKEYDLDENGERIRLPSGRYKTLIEYGKNYTEYKPIHDELKKLKNGWTSKRDKYEEAHRAELTLWK